MCKRLFVLTACVLVLGTVGYAEDIQWTAGGRNNFWSTAANWDLGRAPTAADDVRLDVPAAAAPSGPLIQDGIAALANGIFTEAAGEPTLTMTGGTLDVTDWIWWGDGQDSYAVWTMSGGTANVANELELGWGGGAGTLDMTGGTINAGELIVPTGSGAFGLLYLYGGAINVTKPGGLEVNAAGLIHMTEGVLVLEGDDTAKVNDLIAAGLIISYGGGGVFEVDYDVTNAGKTTVIALAEPRPEPAIGPKVILRVDFNSNQDGGGDSTTAGDPGLSEAAHNQEGWSSYHANHEVIDEFATADYGGITVTPDWPNTADNRVRQSIDRGSGNDANWDDAAGDVNLVTDWIGIDTRTGNGGNGDWDGTTGIPTYMTLALGGLAAGNYKWTSFHHDTEHCHGPFAVWLSTDGGVTFTQLADGIMTDSTEGGTPDSAIDGSYGLVTGPDAYTLPSTYTTSFTANGRDDVVLRFALYSGVISSEVHNQIWGMNGFVLEHVVPVDPGTEGLVAYYALENDVLDSSGNGNDGTIMGDPTFVEGVVGMALEFDGDDFVDTNDVEDLANWTISAWVKSPVAPSADSPSGPVHREKNYQFNWNHSSDTFRAAAALRVGGTWYAASYGPVEADTWYYLTATYDGEDLKAYRNGDLITSNSDPSGAPDAETGTLKLGRHATAEQYFIGTVDEAMVYGRALSDGEISYLAGHRAPYTYDGDAAAAGGGEEHDALDGTWSHNNGSDAWDGTGPGDPNGAPGGASALVDEDGTTFLRIQDTGDPRDYGFSDPSNRKVYLTHQTGIELDGARLEFRIRVATSAPLDDQNPDGGAGIAPWPEGGIGYHIRDDGKGMIGIGEVDMEPISFSLAKAGEIEGLETDALVMNNLAGNEPNDYVDTEDAALATAVNLIPVEDATAWNTFVIDIVAGGAGTHTLTISTNGGPAEVFEVTAGTGGDVGGNYIAMGSSGTGGITAFDVDYISVSLTPPVVEEAPAPVGHWTFDEGAGVVVVDVSGNGNDGVITENPDFVDPTWIDGIEGGALEIHGDTSVYGSADHVQVPNSDSLDIAGPISIALWIRPDADDPEGKGTAGGETAPMAKALSGIDPWNWQVRYGWGGPAPYMSFTFNTSPRAWASVGQNLTQGEWAHIACSHDGETLKCYLNGVETDSTPMGAIATGEAPVLIGSDGWGCDWIGAIDDVRIYDVGLSADEILDIAAGM